jgi:hypothetical protein
MKLISRCCPRLNWQRDRPAFHLKIEKAVRTNGATSVLAGVRPDSETFDALARVCRVLTVGTLPDGDFELTLRDWLAVLLPLSIPEPNQDLANPLNEITSNLDGLAPSIAELVKTAAAGPDTVQSQLHTILNNTLANGEGSDDPA